MVRELSSRAAASIEHIAPDAIGELKEFERKHRLKLVDGEGRLIGFAELVYFGKPVPTYYLEYMQVNDSHRGRGFGGELIEQINAFIKEKRKMGVLINAIEEDKAAYGMYLAHGWKETYIPDLLILNAPEGLSDNAVSDVEQRIMKWTDKVYEKSEEAEQVA